MFTWIAASLRLPALGRRPEVSDRAAVLTLLGRFTDELCSGLLVVLMPTLRARLGLSVQQVAWCFQALTSTAAVVEPAAAAAIDLVRRRPLLVWGAAGWGAALLLAAGATSFGWLLAAFVLVGVTSGPLAHTADVVLVESHPHAVERITSRSTLLDTVGAMTAPVAVALAAWWGVDGRMLLAAAGAGALGYAALLAGTAMPPPPARDGDAGLVRSAVGNVRSVLADPLARRWLAALVLFELLDPLELFQPIWLASVAGASQAFIGLHAAVELGAMLVTLAVLDRWLARHDATPLLVAATTVSLVVFPAWLVVPGLAAKLGLVAVRGAAMAPLWPILRSRALAALPGKGGAAAAVTSLLGLLPINAAIGWVATRVGLTPTLLLVALVGFGGLLALLRRPAPSAAQASR